MKGAFFYGIALKNRGRAINLPSRRNNIMVLNKIPVLAVFLALFLVKAAAPFDRIVNYSATNCVNDFAADGDRIWVATTGGLYLYNQSSGSGTLYSDPVLFPDPEIVTLCIDARLTLWAGSAKGYIYKRTSQGKQTVINAYFMAGWRMTSMDTAGRYLIIGTDHGCSLFDTDKLTVLKNSTGFAEGYPLQVNAIATLIDTLRIKKTLYFRDTFRLQDTLRLHDTLALKDTIAVRDTFVVRDTFAVRDTLIIRDTTVVVRDTIHVLSDTMIHQEMLLLGTDKGIVKLYDTGKALLRTLAGANFYDRTIWKIDPAVSSVVHTIVAFPGGYRTLAGPGVRFKNSILFADSNALYSDNRLIDTFPSKVTVLYSKNDQECLVGTGKTGFFIWNGTTAPRAVKIDGPAFSYVTNIAVDRDGGAWVSPQVSAKSPNPRWEGYSVFRNNYWQIYSPVDFPAIGWMGQGVNKGAAQDCMGRMWFGSDGGSVKRYDPATNSWLKYCIYASIEGAAFESNLTGACTNNWAMTDAITADSTGFLWIACFNNWAGTLIGYNPKFEPDPTAQDYEKAHYRRFWPKGDEFYSGPTSTGINMITTDVANNIIVGYPNGHIVVFRHNGNPLKDGIRVTTVFTKNTSIVIDAASTPDSLTRVVSAGGFYTFDARSNQFVSGLWTVSPALSGSLTLVDSTLKLVSAIAAEDENVLWLGTVNSGIIRYDLTSNTKTIVDETQGLLSNQITGLSIDRKGGYLWIASDRGVSRYTIGYQIGVRNSGPPVVYPNPFSKRRHKELVFEKLPPGGKVLLYTVSGSLVASLTPQDASVYGSACVWKPAASIVPGIYLFTIRSSTKSTKGRILITP